MKPKQKKRFVPFHVDFEREGVYGDDIQNGEDEQVHVTYTRDLNDYSIADESNDYSSDDDDDHKFDNKHHGDKFMVCDHCRGHGLPCNEAPVCNQCQISETACIHRSCRLSPTNIDNCHRTECRYAHKDHLPVPEQAYSVQGYIILPGKLRDYLADGEVPRQDFGDLDIDDMALFDKEARERQASARKALDAAVRAGTTTLENQRGVCGKDRVEGDRYYLYSEDEDEDEEGEYTSEEYDSEEEEEDEYLAW